MNTTEVLLLLILLCLLGLTIGLITGISMITQRLRKMGHKVGKLGEGALSAVTGVVQDIFDDELQRRGRLEA